MEDSAKRSRRSFETEYANAFPQEYSVVKGVLDKLGLSDLLSASKVCKNWLDVGRVVRKNRKNRAKATTCLWHPYGDDHTDEVIEYYNGYAVSASVRRYINIVAPSLGFPTEQELTQDQSWSPMLTQMRQAVLKSFNQLYWEPQILIWVCTASVDEYMPSDEDNYTKLKIILSDIPKAVPCLLTFSYGIVGSIKNEQKSWEMENSEIPMIAGLAIPKFPGMVVKMFTVTKETNSTYKGKVDSDNCKTILNIGPEDDVRGIILFHTDVRKAGALKDAVLQYLKDNPHVALGGGAHYRNLASECHGDYVPIGAGLIICGNKEHVNVASIGLFDSKISARNEEKLREMKSCEFPGGDSFAFMFACNGRGAHMHGSINVESALFRKYFPKTSLIGTFTGGEYCHEVIPSRLEVKPPKNHSSVEFAYTTVFVFVTYKYPTNM